MKIVIIGATGLLGKYLLRVWDTDNVIGFGSKDVDIRDLDQVQRIVEPAEADWIVLTAAYTDVDGCEINPGLAFATNRDGAANVAKAARDCGSRMLFLSTDYVFDGTKSSPYEVNDLPNPRSVYGRSKAEAEDLILKISPNICIVRTSWVFGMGKCFPDTILRLAFSRTEVEVVDDQRGCPTYARDLAIAIKKLCCTEAKGLVHATNRGDCTWYEFASEILHLSESSTLARATTSDRFPRPAERPRYSVLSSKSLERYRIVMPSWQQALRDYIAERRLVA